MFYRVYKLTITHVLQRVQADNIRVYKLKISHVLQSVQADNAIAAVSDPGIVVVVLNEQHEFRGKMLLLFFLKQKVITSKKHWKQLDYNYFVHKLNAGTVNDLYPRNEASTIISCCSVTN